MDEYLFEVDGQEVRIQADSDTLAWVTVALQHGKEAMSIKLVGFRWKGIEAGVQH